MSIHSFNSSPIPRMAEKFKNYAGRGTDPKLKLEQFKQVCNEADRTVSGHDLPLPAAFPKAYAYIGNELLLLLLLHLVIVGSFTPAQARIPFLAGRCG